MGKENPLFGGEMLQEYRMMINVPLNYLPFVHIFSFFSVCANQFKKH